MRFKRGRDDVHRRAVQVCAVDGNLEMGAPALPVRQQMVRLLPLLRLVPRSSEINGKSDHCWQEGYPEDPERRL
jgi:hypothetical protein